MSGFGLPVLFVVLTCGFVGIAVAGALAGGRGWVIAAASGALSVWMATLAANVLRRTRR